MAKNKNSITSIEFPIWTVAHAGNVAKNGMSVEAIGKHGTEDGLFIPLFTKRPLASKYIRNANGIAPVEIKTPIAVRRLLVSAKAKGFTNVGLNVSTAKKEGHFITIKEFIGLITDPQNN